VIWGTSEGLLDHLQVQQVVSAASGNDTQTSGEDIEQGRGVPIQAV